MPENLFDRLRPKLGASAGRDCAWVRSKLPEYLDADIVPADRKWIEIHCERCVECRAELSAYWQSESALTGSASSIPSPGDLRPEFYARLEQTRRRPVTFRWGLALPALASVLVVSLVATQLRRGTSTEHNPGSTSPPAVTRDHVSIRSLGVMRAHSSVQEIPATNSAAQMAVRQTSEHSPVPVRLRRSGQRVNREVAKVYHEPRRHRIAVPTHQAGAAGALVAVNQPLPKLGRTLSLQPTRDRTALSAEAGLYRLSAKVAPADSNLAFLSRTGNSGDADRTHTVRLESKVALASLEETELHVSDESRDFMSSTHVDSTGSRRDDTETVRVDDGNAAAHDSAELPSLP